MKTTKAQAEKIREDLPRINSKDILKVMDLKHIEFFKKLEEKTKMIIPEYKKQQHARRNLKRIYDL